MLSERSLTKRVWTMRFHLCEILEEESIRIMAASGGEWEQGLTGMSKRGLSRIMLMLYIFNGWITQVYEYVKT